MTGLFPKGYDGQSWRETAEEHERLTRESLRGASTETIFAMGTEANTYAQACEQAIKSGEQGAVVLPMEKLRWLACMAAQTIMREMACREEEFNRAAAQWSS